MRFLLVFQDCGETGRGRSKSPHSFLFFPSSYIPTCIHSGMGPKRKISRKFHGNRFTGSLQESSSADICFPSTSTSSKKVKLAASVELPEEPHGNRLVLVTSLIKFIEQLSCSACNENLQYSNETVYGLASCLDFACDCDHKKSLVMSEKSTVSGHFQVNDRMQVSMYELGKNYEGAKKTMWTFGSASPCFSAVLEHKQEAYPKCAKNRSLKKYEHCC